MSTLPQVQGLTLNQSSLLQSLRHAFAGKGSLVLELVQNARRAGATRVSVDYDAKLEQLTVSDDGEAISDPNKLFAVGESGWDQHVREADKPLGVGLLSAVYQARHMDIRSGPPPVPTGHGCEQPGWDAEVDGDGSNRMKASTGKVRLKEAQWANKAPIQPFECTRKAQGRVLATRRSLALMRISTSC